MQVDPVRREVDERCWAFASGEIYSRFWRNFLGYFQNRSFNWIEGFKSCVFSFFVCLLLFSSCCCCLFVVKTTHEKVVDRYSVVRGLQVGNCSIMDQLPVEVIGNILSHLRAARDVVIASASCRKWRLACCKHLHTLSFNSKDWPIYRDLTTTRLEILITQTIFQTSGLQSLSILMEDVDEFSASTVTAWLLYTRETLRQLHYNVKTTPNVNILEICGRHKLEILDLAHNSIVGVEPNYQRFPCLKSLSLIYIIFIIALF